MNDVKKTLKGLSRRQLALLSEKLKEKTAQATRQAPQFEIKRRPDRFASCRLSFAQQRLWFIDQLEPGKAIYNCPGAVTLYGEIDLNALERSINEIVRRHEALRTRIEVDAGVPVQVIDQWEPRKLDVIDLTRVNGREREEEAERLANVEANTGFDLSRGPLFRVKVLKLAEDKRVLLYTMHHIVSDQWSMEILFREVGILYQTYLAGKESPLPELEIQYADYAEWQREYLTGETLKREVGYWKERLKGAAALDLPADYSRPAAPSHRGGRVRMTLDKDIHNGLKRMAQESEVTIFMLMMAAFKVVLMRYSHEEDIGVGTAIANRSRKELEGLIGFFLNTLVIRTDLSGNPSFRELMKREREVALGAYAHQEAPFEKLVEELNPERAMSRTPLFQVMMELENARLEESPVEGMKLSGIGKKIIVAKFDLALNLTEYADGISGSLIYSRDLFDEETARRMAGHYQQVVKEVVEDSTKRIWQIELLSVSEREQILGKWNQTVVDYPRLQSVQAIFEDQAQRTPERIALAYENQEVSFGELNRWANQLAHYLRRRGVGPEAPVGIFAHRGVEAIVGVLGILKAGGAYLLLDPASSPENLRHMLEDARPPVLLTEERLLGRLHNFYGKTLCLDRDWRLVTEESCENPEPVAGEDALAYVIYASDSTGRPNGVMGVHRALINRVAWMWETYPFGSGEICCQKISLNFDSVWEILDPLLQGARTVIVGDEAARDAGRLASILQSEEVSRITLAPSLLRSLMDQIDDLPGALPQLKYCLINSGSVSAGLSEAFSDKFPESGLLNLYGSLEVSAAGAWHEIGGNEKQSRVFIGRPIANTQIYFLDSYLQSAPMSVPGELHVGGHGIARGYLNRADLTAERFIPNPYSEGSNTDNRLYKTSDLGRWLNDGKIEYINGGDARGKACARRVISGEFEAVTLQYNGVRDHALEGRGEEVGATRLVARQGLILSRELTQNLNELSRLEGVTLFVTLLAGFKLLLARYMGQTKIAVGIPVSGRNRAETEDHLGFIVDRLVLHTDLSGAQTLRELLQQARRSALGAYARQDLPFEKLIEELQRDRNLSQHPFFEVLFSYINVSPSTARSDGIAPNRLDVIGAASKFPLALYVKDDHSRIMLQIDHQQAVFSSEQITVMIDHYRELLSQMVERPDEAIASYSLLTGKSHPMLPDPKEELAEPAFDLVTEMFDSWAISLPRRIAVTQGGLEWSYEELAERARRIARLLIGCGLKPGQTVMVCGGKSFGMIASILATSLSGGVLFTLDRKLTTARQRAMCEIAEVKRVLFVGAAEQIEDWGLEGHLADTLIVDPGTGSVVSSLGVDFYQESSDGNHSISLPKLSPADPAYIFFTSGSTGAPKGVLGLHKSLSHFLAWQREEFAISASDRVGQLTGLAFDAVLRDVYLPLTSGATLCLPDEDAVSSGGVIAWLDRARVTVLHTVPALAQSWLMNAPKGQLVRSLRIVFFSGEPLTSKLVESWRQLIWDRCEIVNFYGPTETTMIKCFYRVPADCSPGPQSVGKPMPQTQALVLRDCDQLCGIGEIGEIAIRTPFRTLGYINAPEEAKQRFIKNPFRDDAQDLIYRTGDLGRYRGDGSIELLGRIDQQVKLRGIRIEPGEIESVLAEREDVAQCAVNVWEDNIGEKRLVAYVVASAEKTVSIGELRTYLREKLPDYMVPTAFVALRELPLTASGKVDRKALPQPELAARDKDDRYQEQRTETEEVMVGVWRQVLRVERVGIEDNFFELGGHSLLATQVVSRIREVFKVEMPLRAIFEEKTLADLSRRVEAEQRAEAGVVTPPIKRASREGRLPLSFAQQRLWFVDQMDPGNAVYNIPGAVRLEGPLNIQALESVINEIVRRHEILRTRIEVEAGNPEQVIDAWERRRLEVVDLTSLTWEEKKEEIRRRAREEAETGFDLSRGPLLRVKVLKLEEEDHLTLYTMHHLVSDEWSTGILIREVGALYQSYLAGEQALLPELEIQYADFAVWQRGWLQGAALAAELEYWRKQLAGMETLELPTDYPRPVEPSYRGGSRGFAVETDLAEKLRALGRREGSTLFMTMLASFDVLMARYSGQEDVALGTDIANRNRTEIENLIGFFVNQLVLKVAVRPGETFKELLKRVRGVCLGAYAHQDLPFEKLVEELQPERDLSRSPLFQVKLILQNAPMESLEMEGVKLTRGSVHDARLASQERPARFDLSVFIIDDGSDLIGAVNYSRDLFEEETIERLINHYANVLKAAVEESERPISELSMLSDEEREQIVVEWNETGRFYPNDRCVHELIAEQAERSPERVALIYEGRQVSYGELNRRANQLGNYLQRLGIGPEVVVGVCLERSVEMVVALLGTLKAGGAYLPLDPESPVERLSYMMENAEVALILTRRELGERLPALWGRTICLDDDWEKISEEAESEAESEVDAENLAYVIYTSGSTGRPKGVMINHGGLANYLRWATEAYRIGEGEGAPVNSPIGFDLTVTSLYGALVNGKRAHLLSEEEGIEALATAMRRERGYSLVKITPSHLEALAEQLRNSDIEGRAGVMVIGGEELKTGGLRFWREKAPGVRLINEYGPTETVVGCCVYEINGAETERESAPIGRPIANTRIYVLDQGLDLAPVGGRGEIGISGVGLARGYVRSPELTGVKFIPNRFGGKAGERLYRTGDLGRYLPDGNLEYSGRADDQVKVRGYRVELREIQSALNEHGSVRQSVVMAIEDEKGARRLIAYVVGDESAAPAELKTYLREKLPVYMVPEAILVLEEIPLTANGKIDRKRLPSLKDAIRPPEQDYAGARTPIEEMVVGIFEELLNLDRVGIHDNFFYLGGHSLLAIQLISRVRNAFGVELGVRSIFEEPTAERLAWNIEEAMRSGEKAQAPPLVRVEREKQSGNKFPLSFPQKRLWFIDRLDPGNPAYNLPGSMNLEGSLNLEALDRVINEIFRRHEVLRTRIEMEAGEPVQIIDAWEPRRLDVVDLRSWPREKREEEVARRIREEARTGFDLSRGPLFRVKVLKLEDEEHIVIYTMHHIVSDGWSKEILIREVEALYRAYSAGEESPLEELEIQYADYSVWQRNWLQGEALERQLSYWKRQLKGAPATLALPVNRRRPSTQNHRGEKQWPAISAELTAKLKDLSRRQDVTLFMVLLTAFKALLYRYSWQEDIVVGIGVANRTHQETERLIGFFVNMLALRTNLSGNPTFTELLARVREVALGAYAHQDMPFDLLVEELRPERDLRRTPLFQVVFVLQNKPEPTIGPQPLEAPEVRLVPMGISSSMRSFDLMMSMEETPQGVRGTLEYDSELFDATTIAKMLKDYADLLKAMAACPECRVLEAPLHLEDESYLAPAHDPQNKSTQDLLETEKFHF